MATDRLSPADKGSSTSGSDDAWEKVRRFALKAGKHVIREAMVLYYCLRDPDTPGRAKAIIIGALGYFILPFDCIPDLIPGAGFTDDLAVLIMATKWWQR